MIGRYSPVVIALAVVLLLGGLDLDATHQARAATYDTIPPLFSNYYVAPGNCGGVPSQLYVSPRPVPPVVGHTYITYQPLMPHEFLYPHSRAYVRYNFTNGCRTCTYCVR